MAKKKPIRFRLVAEGVGPIPSARFETEIDRFSVGIYANNGGGKTFLSRMLRLADTSAQPIATNVTDTYLLRGRGGARIELRVEGTNSEQSVRALDVRLKSGEQPEVQNDTGYLFHVFNSDYVNENLSAHDYTPAGNIDGYILGQANVNVEREKEALASAESERDQLRQVLESDITAVQAELVDLGVRSTTNEYRLITVDQLLSKKRDTNEVYSEVRASYDKAISLPEDLSDIPSVPTLPSLGTVDQITLILATPYQASDLPGNLVDRIKKKLPFIRSGLDHMHAETGICPFCEQELQDAAVALIHSYQRYVSDEEARARTEISSSLSSIDHFERSLTAFERDLLHVAKRFDELKQFIPSKREVSIDVATNVNEIRSLLRSLRELLKAKDEDIGRTDLDPRSPIQALGEKTDRILASLDASQREIDSINQTKNDMTTERLDLRRKLCLSRFAKLGVDREDTIARFRELSAQCETLAEQIANSEANSRRSRRDAVAESFREFLNYFFQGKYSFDDDRFRIVFDGESMSNGVSRVLSDGEKSVVAFCYFLAESHRLVSRDADYEDLVFVIDDPISSMDFHYVYAMAELLRHLRVFMGTKRSRVILLTHSIEFMGILLRNRVLAGGFSLAGSTARVLQQDLVMPYEGHLRDVLDVSTSRIEPSHHTPNSIRHVLETIVSFESPGSQVATLFQHDKELKDNGFLYSLINDGSHGAVRRQRAYTEDQIVSGCKTVIGFIKKRFPGQLARLDDA